MRYFDHDDVRRSHALPGLHRAAPAVAPDLPGLCPAADRPDGSRPVRGAAAGRPPARPVARVRGDDARGRGGGTERGLRRHGTRSPRPNPRPRGSPPAGFVGPPHPAHARRALLARRGGHLPGGGLELARRRRPDGGPGRGDGDRARPGRRPPRAQAAAGERGTVRRRSGTARARRDRRSSRRVARADRRRPPGHAHRRGRRHRLARPAPRDDLAAARRTRRPRTGGCPRRGCGRPVARRVADPDAGDNGRAAAARPGRDGPAEHRSPRHVVDRRRPGLVLRRGVRTRPRHRRPDGGPPLGTPRRLAAPGRHTRGSRRRPGRRTPPHGHAGRVRHRRAPRQLRRRAGRAGQLVDRGGPERPPLRHPLDRRGDHGARPTPRQRPRSRWPAPSCCPSSRPST